MKKMLISAIILLLQPICGQSYNYRWEIIPGKTGQPVVFIEGENTDDFWAGTVSGNLYHFKNYNPIIYNLPDIDNIIRCAYYKIDDIILCGVTTKNQKGDFYILKDGLWLKSKFTIDVPVKNFIESTGGTVYCYCDWGILLKFDGNDFKQIDYPFENHILTSVLFENNIYFGTRKDGIIKFDEENFKQIKFEDFDKTDINEFLLRDSILFAKKYNNNIISLRNDKVFEKNNIPETIFEKYKAISFGLQSVRFNQNIVFPEDYKIVNHKIFNPGEVLLASEKGNLYLGKPDSSNYFYELSDRYFNRSNYNIKYNGAAFTDLNNDGYPDVLISASEKTDYPMIFLNNPRSYFADITTSSGLLKIEKPFDNFDITDLNKDGHPDILFYYRTPNSAKIKTFIQNDNLSFSFFDSTAYPTLPYNQHITNSFISDVNSDGKPDLILSSYFSSKLTTGSNFTLINNGNGYLTKYDSSASAVSRGWIYQTIVADFNNDNFDDRYTISLWTPNKLLIYNKETEMLESRPGQIPEIGSSFSGGAIDYDNDGDLDLFIASETNILQLLENDGNGTFKDVTPDKGLKGEEHFSRNNSIRTLNFGDFNNDGYTDVFISIKKTSGEANKLLLNKEAEIFIDVGKNFQLDTSFVNGAAIADFDNDGDLDMVTCGNGFIKFLVNNLNNKSYLEILPKGVKAPVTAEGTKVWIYKAGKINDDNYLFGYKQTGSDKAGFRIQNDHSLHFGVNNKFKYDVKVRVPGGNERILLSVKPSQKLVISELTGIEAYIYRLPGIIYRTAINTEIQIYFSVTLFVLLLSYFSIRRGIEIYDWDQKTTGTLLAVNTSIYWLIILLSKNSDSFFVKYFLASVVVLSALILPYFFSYRIKKHSAVIFNKQKSEDELLNAMMAFSHGQWALRNLNSLQLLLSNAKPEMILEQKFKSQIKERIDTFINITGKEIEKITEIAKLTGSFDKLIFKIDENKKLIKNNLVFIRNQNSNLDFDIINSIVFSIIKIKKDISELRKQIFTEHSCNLLETVKNVLQDYESVLSEKNIIVERTKDIPNNSVVLIKGNELADILSNSITNSVRALEKQSSPKIKINIYRSVPKYIIEISDNGEGINEEIKNDIFSKGFSGGLGTGIGLNIAVNTLEKYGGRIFLKESVPFEKTIFIIELNEGNFNGT